MMNKSRVLKATSPHELFLMSNFGSYTQPHLSVTILNNSIKELPANPFHQFHIDKRIQDNILSVFPGQLDEYKLFLSSFNMVSSQYGCSLYNGLLYLAPLKNVELQWLQEEESILEIRFETPLITTENKKKTFSKWADLIP